jgi:lipoate-protein ligase A
LHSSPGPPSPAPLRFLDLTYSEIEANLALDEALLAWAEAGETGPLLRLWEAPGLAVVLGASSRIREDVEVELCRAEGVPIARRSSGGGTVVIGPGALNVTVVLGADDRPGLHAVDSAQAYVLGCIATSIRRHVPAVEVMGLGDLTLGNRKFGGSAQRRMRRWFLVHASLLYDFPIDRVARYTRIPRRAPAYREGRPHAAFLTNIPLSRPTLVESIRSTWPLAEGQIAKVPVPEDLVRQLIRNKFGDPAWTERL